MYGAENVLVASEIRNAGFIHVPKPAFVAYNDTDEAVRENFESIPRHLTTPMLTKTYLLYEAYEERNRPVPEAFKQEIIFKMKEIGIRWVYRVYFGEIYIPLKLHPLGGCRNVYVRGKIKTI
jgi:hypothetical protein